MNGEEHPAGSQEESRLKRPESRLGEEHENKRRSMQGSAAATQRHFSLHEIKLVRVFIFSLVCVLSLQTGAWEQL